MAALCQWVSVTDHLKSMRNLKRITDSDPDMSMFITSTAKGYGAETLLVHVDGSCFQFNMLDSKEKCPVPCDLFQPETTTIDGVVYISFPNLCPDILFQRRGTKLYSQDGQVRVIRAHCEMDHGLTVATSTVKFVDLIGIRKTNVAPGYEVLNRRLEDTSRFKYVFQNVLLHGIL
jgi:hypothetical protein